MDADQHRLILHRHVAAFLDADAAHAQRQMRLWIDNRRVGDQIEVTEARWQFDRQFTADQPLALPAELDEILDGTHLQTMLFGKRTQVRQPGHRAVGR